jgi:hypothetical protein
VTAEQDLAALEGLVVDEPVMSSPEPSRTRTAKARRGSVFAKVMLQIEKNYFCQTEFANQCIDLCYIRSVICPRHMVVAKSHVKSFPWFPFCFGRSLSQFSIWLCKIASDSERVHIQLRTANDVQYRQAVELEANWAPPEYPKSEVEVSRLQV